MSSKSSFSLAIKETFCLNEMNVRLQINRFVEKKSLMEIIELMTLSTRKSFNEQTKEK